MRIDFLQCPRKVVWSSCFKNRMAGVAADRITRERLGKAHSM